MRILVTGGTGFLGRSMLPMLAGHELFVLSRGGQNEADFPENINWIRADLGEGLDVRSLPEKMDAVIHLAQSHHYRDFPGGASDVFKINVEVPALLLGWAQKAGVSRFVAASSGSVYEPFTGAMKEDEFVSPTGFYGASKLAAEALALAWQGQFDVAQLRVFFLYGPGQQGMMIANIINSIKEGKKLTLPKGNDGLVFVPTYVDDTARAFVRACLDEDSWSGVYNVAAPHKVSFKRLIEEIGKAVGVEPVVERVDAAMPTPIVPDLTKISGKLDIQSFLTLEQGLKKTVLAK